MIGGASVFGLPEPGFLGLYHTSGSTESGVQFPMPAGTVRQLRVRVRVAAGGAGSGNTWIFTVHNNGVATAVTCTIFESATSCSDVVNSGTFAAGDLISVRVQAISNPADGDGVWTAQFTE